MTGLELFCPSGRLFPSPSRASAENAVHPFPRPAHGAHPPGWRRIQAHSRARAHAHTLTLLAPSPPPSLPFPPNLGRTPPSAALPPPAHGCVFRADTRVCSTARAPAAQQPCAEHRHRASTHDLRLPRPLFLSPALQFIGFSEAASQSPLNEEFPGYVLPRMRRGRGRPRGNGGARAHRLALTIHRSTLLFLSCSQRPRVQGPGGALLRRPDHQAGQRSDGCVRGQAGLGACAGRWRARGGRPTSSSHHDSNIPRSRTKFADRLRRPLRQGRQPLRLRPGHCIRPGVPRVPQHPAAQHPEARARL
jgi:hypothetical protein